MLASIRLFKAFPIVALTVSMLTIPVLASSQSSLDNYLEIPATQLNTSFSGSATGNIRNQEITFESKEVGNDIEVLSVELVFIQQGYSNGIMRVVNRLNMQIIEAKSLSLEGQKKTSDIPFQLNSDGKIEVSPLLLQTSDLEVDAVINLTDIIAKVSYRIIDSDPPQILELDVFDVTPSTASIWMKSSETVTVEIKHGKTSRYSNSIKVDQVSEVMEYTISGLSQGTTYHYSLILTDKSGNITETPNRTFTTSLENGQILGSNVTTVSKDKLSPPIITLLEAIEEQSAKSIQINWKQGDDQDVDGYIIYRSNSVNGEYFEIKKVGKETFSIIDYEVEEESTYYYKIRSIQGSNQSILSDYLAIYIPAEITSPIRISNEEQMSSISKTLILLIAGIIVVVGILYKISSKIVSMKRESENKKKKRQNKLKDPAYYSDSF
ncbi:fibronectin type III domain-containing protein [Candidatus Dojkabacteria bacterium]|uniref:Fibronectin type III domain-containing protein n=1 Tax=Candidatus Dojkabacteria bacterium TaxID=2099670 RepID=A0A952AHJ4_9BACT|nr:fibronectin type III domain-containing protein [Candidatus Dojkabacteria bacterium]